MLKYLTVQTAPVAHTENTVLFEDYRITVLQDRLFRIEHDPQLRFNDNATQHIWFRNVPPQRFTVTRGSMCVTISTAYVALTVAHDFSKSYVEINGKKLPLENTENLLGTTRTLDRYDGEILLQDGSRVQLENGVCSKNGVAVIDDTNTLRLDPNGKLIPATEELCDLYVFAFGNDYRAAVRALYAITGSVPMLPRFAFGNWWSRYHAYTDEEYLHLMDQFSKRGIPLTVATLDIDWHYSAHLDEEKSITASHKNTADRGCIPHPRDGLGWTGYSWNQNLFPNYKDFLARLHERGLKVTLNLHPGSGVRYFEDMYPEMACAMGIDPATEQVIPFDIANDAFVKAYFEILHHPYEKDGVDFWWIDWQQGTDSEMEGLDPLWALNHYHYLDNTKNGNRPLIMSRYAGIGSHRYPIGFSGDTSISWKTLEFMPYFTATSANIGYTWWGHDIGGHHLGIKDDELYLRFLQFGVFNPINRMHCTDSPVLTKEPWAYENGIGELAKNMMTLRHSMIPFLYTANYLTHTRGLALCEPLYYEYPTCPESYTFRNEYLFGQSFIVAPVTHHSEEHGLTAVHVWLPEGVWTDMFTGEVYRVPAGGHTLHAVRPLDSIPVFAKEGAVMVHSLDAGNRVDNPAHLEVQIWNGNGEFTLYEDSMQAQAFTHFALTRKSDDCQTVTIRCRGDFSALPASRKLTLVFPNMVVHHPADAAFGITRTPAKITVLKNGTLTQFEIDAYAEVRITVANFDPCAKYEIEVVCPALSEFDEARRTVLGKLQKTQAPFQIRNRLLERLLKAKGTEHLKGLVLLSDLSAIDKQRLTETIFYGNENT